MNPPFSGGDGDTEEHEFVTRALEFMDDGGILFSPYTVELSGRRKGAEGMARI